MYSFQNLFIACPLHAIKQAKKRPRKLLILLWRDGGVVEHARLESV
tara:strand:+ start:2649 stop:2786 length:138 start_codon:yes stop_codon:yes gene_type:complete